MRIFDSHTHYNDEAFDKDRRTLLDALPEKGVCGAVCCGCDFASSERAVKLSEEYPYIYAAVGIHPENAARAEELSTIRRLTEHEKCVAIGEIGLDYHYTEENKAEQRALFESQLMMAEELSLPVIIHERDAYADCLEILKKHTPKRGVMHCFSGNKETLREILSLGLYIGVGGTLTFKNNKKTVEMLPFVPEDRLLFETDAPYLSPEPVRGKRNDSTNIFHVACRAAQILNKDAEELLEKSSANAEKFFGIRLRD